MAGKVLQWLSYTRCELWTIFRTLGNKPTVNKPVWKTLGECGIKKLYRGCSAGAKKQRKIKVVLGHGQTYCDKQQSVNLHNLTKIRCQFKKDKKLKVGYINARSVCNKASDVNDLIVDHRLDVLAISETWLSNGAKDKIVSCEMTPDGYDNKVKSVRSGKGGGVAVVYKKSLKPTVEKREKYTSFEVLETVLKDNFWSFRISVIYRPPSTSRLGKPISIFLEEFEKYIDSCSISSGHLVVVGDFNIHMEKATNQDTKKLSDLLYSMNLHQHIHSPTHEKGHTLDLVMTRSTDSLLTDLQVHPPVFL